MENKNILYSFDSLMQHGLVGPDGERHDIKKVLIPMIQRPYAQGRKSRKDIRDKFISEIFECITGSNLMELNFVYGTLRDGVFELLDGQQRLTTLFLLHWYIATKDGEKPEYLNKFTYETRTSSTNFINKLVQQGVALNGAPSEEIRAAYWYSKSFDKDTTIDSMLRMLDCIDEHYKKAEQKPAYADLSKLQFYALDLKEFGLTEELFIKMNARGLQLTPFENFKADLIGYMKKNPQYHEDTDLTIGSVSRQVPYWLYFSSMLDGAWQDLFWEKPDNDDFEQSGGKESDKSFFRFVQRYITNKLIDPEVKKIREDKNFQFFWDNTEIDRHNSFKPYREVFENAFQETGFDYVKNLDKVLCFLSNAKIGPILRQSLHAPWGEKKNWLPWSAEGVSYRQMALISAMTEYVERVETIDDFDVTNYERWMRIVHNIVENSPAGNPDEQITLTHTIKNLLNSEDYVIAHPYSSLVSFAKSRKQKNRILEAEAKKASVILEAPEWEDAFIEAERNPFLAGFVTVYYEDGMTVETYRKRTARVPMLFCEKGVNSHFSQNFRLLRAVIARDNDWTTAHKGYTFFTVSNEVSDTERSIKGRTIWNDSTSVKKLFSDLLDCETEAEMDELVDRVATEDNEAILRDSYWGDNKIVERIKLGYKRLFQTDEMDALKWLYENPRYKSLALVIDKRGKTELYAGNINCMVLCNNRHKIVPQLMDKLREFQLRYHDSRQEECFNAYHNYNGFSVCIANVNLFSDNEGLFLDFDGNDILNICLARQEKLDNIEKLLSVNESLQQYETGQTFTKEGKAKTWIDSGLHYYQMLSLNYEETSVDEIASVLRTVKEKIDAWNQ